jgi:hypothetical protein
MRIVEQLRRLPEITFAELVHPVYLRGTPNDSLFHLQWNMQNLGQFNGTVDADVDATDAWDHGKGSSSDLIGVIDGGVSPSNPDLSGRITGTTGSSDHATHIAGIAGARGNNTTGVAGLNWICTIRSEPMGGSTATSAASIHTLTDAGVKVHNDSWGGTAYSFLWDEAFAYAYKNNVLSAVAMPELGVPGDYPSSIARGILNVGATTNTDTPTGYTLSGAYVDVVAPGGNGQGIGFRERDIYSTLPGNSYGYAFGTSFAAPHGAGAASLLRRFGLDSLGITLYNDDLDMILSRSAEDVGASGFDNLTGWGRINVRRAIEWGRTPNVIYQQTAAGGTPFGVSGFFSRNFYTNTCGLGDGLHQVRRHEVRRAVTFPRTFSTVPLVWGRGVATIGFSDEDPNFAEGWCEPVAGTVTTSGCTLRTYVFEEQLTPKLSVWCPTTLENVSFAWTVMEQLPTSTLTPDPTQSYFVPQAVASGSVVEGPPAIKFFVTCPNLDGTQVLKNKARIKVVAKDSGGNGIAGISASDIFVLLNGGTAAQSFIGEGADSITADPRWTPLTKCPSLRVISADTATDASGSTYITFIGRGGQRDTTRKWGHYDFDMPVYVLGTRIKGKFTSSPSDPLGLYQLRIKNADFAGGLGTLVPDPPEIVNAFDNNYHLAHPDDYWYDFDWDGDTDTIDDNFFNAHRTPQAHTCRFPNTETNP